MEAAACGSGAGLDGRKAGRGLGASAAPTLGHQLCSLSACLPASWPAGQFGTRLQGGKDAASPRYIFTRLAPLTRHLFNEHDDRLLAYLNEEGQSIEPEWWVGLRGPGGAALEGQRLAGPVQDNL